MITCENVFPTKIIFGKGTRLEIGKRLKEYTNNVLFVYGGGSIKRTGLYDEITNSFKDNGIEFIELGGIKSNPTLEKVNDAIALIRENKIDFILGVGGGSVLDTAKAAALGALYEGNVWDFFCGKAKIERALPVATILTIPGTGSESSPNVVISNADTKEKIGIHDTVLRPVFSIMDPEVCVTIPKSQVSNGVYDMLSHTMERYFTNTIHTDIIDGVAEGVMRGIIKNGLIAYEDPTDENAWAELMIGSDFSHNGMTGFGRECDWSNHGMEEVISGIYDCPHGAGLAVTTLAWMKYVYKRHIPMFVQFAVNVMGCSGSFREQERLAYDGIRALEDFTKKMGLPTTMKELGIDDSQFEFMAKRAVGYKGETLGCLEKLTWQDVLNIYRIANEEDVEVLS
jgi:hypothetical protein